MTDMGGPSNERRGRAAEGGRAREVAQRISQEVRFLMKNVPVSRRNADTQLVIAWELENAAMAIRNRVRRRRSVPAANDNKG